MKKILLVLALAAAVPLQAAGARARNVILFLGDAGGIPTLNAASIYGHDRPQALFLQSLPHLALIDTSPVDYWVSDSAAGMTAIVTGQKTNNSTLSKAARHAKGETDTENLKTILEHAEERGLATGVMTNMPVWDATPAACYAHANSRKTTGEIFAQVLTPAFGDGVDILIGADRTRTFAETEKLGLQIEPALRARGYQVFAAPADIPADASRAVAVYDGQDFDPKPVLERVIKILSRNPKGFFLMVEWDMHTGNLVRGLERALVMDALIRQTAAQVGDDTLILFTADHSSDLRVLGGKRGEPLVSAATAVPGLTPDPKPKIRGAETHSAEEVLAVARGPGAERLRGFMANTDLFHVMMAAYGWETPSGTQ